MELNDRATAQKFKLSKELRHLELGKTLLKKPCFFEAFDHFKSSIQHKHDCGIDILIFLYKTNTKKSLEQQLLIAKIYLELGLPEEAFASFEDILEEKIDHEPTYETLAKLISKNN